MPVLVTLATINLLFRGSQSASFLDPAGLAGRLEDEVEREEAREQALALARELERLAASYEESVSRGLEAYAASTRDPDARAGDLIAVLEPLDRGRQQTLEEIVRVRQALLETLTADEWDRVFD